jgi:anti-sigma factor RsiW
MTCQEFNDQLPDYIDDTLDAARRANVQGHLEACRECQLALRRTQALGRALQGALERETTHLALAPDRQETILRAARSVPAEPTEERRDPWRFWRPLGALAAATAVAAVLLVAGRWERPRAQPSAKSERTRGTWSIDVPFQSGQQVGVIHAEFSEP